MCEAVQLFTADISRQVVGKCQTFGNSEKACGRIMWHTKWRQLACLNNGPPRAMLGFVHSSTFKCSCDGLCRLSVRAQKVLTEWWQKYTACQRSHLHTLGWFQSKTVYLSHHISSFCIWLNTGALLRYNRSYQSSSYAL